MATLPPLITEQGLVLNNMMPDEGALGNYTPPGTASSEGISLMLRGVLRAALATGGEDKKDFATFLFNAACMYFFKDFPTDDPTQRWDHSWLVNGGASFNVRGPLQINGDLAQSGYLFGRDPQSTVTFTDGIGQLVPAPDIVYQAVSTDTEFVWENMFSELNQGHQYEVDYYIDSMGNKVFGTQKGGSYGQPSIPAGEHSDGNPGKIVLKEPIDGPVGVNFCITVGDTRVAYTEMYEAWPMWRQLATNEVSTASDAIHWFIDAFALGMELEPENENWKNAFDRMHAIWNDVCHQDSAGTYIFKAGAEGDYNSFPLTYSYAYGRSNVDDPSSDWNDRPPTLRYQVSRASDGYVTFDLPKAMAELGSGGNIRYGVAFENKPLYLTYNSKSYFNIDMGAAITQTINASIENLAGDSYTASLLVQGTGSQRVDIGQFFKFQNEPGDADGTQTGDWSGEGTGELPVYDAVPFPGRRLAMVGDSITWYNTAYVAPVQWNGLFENWGFGQCGYWTHADQILKGRLVNEPAVSTDVSGYKHGLNFAIAGTRVANWWLPLHDTLGDGVMNVGPMYAALNNIGRFDVVLMLGGTNDLAGNLAAGPTLFNIQKAATDLASKGKWVYLLTIPPRSRGELRGYTVIQQDIIRQRLLDINAGLRAWCAEGNPNKPNNIFLVDVYPKLLGPNGVDPAGSLSDSTGGPDTPGNFHPSYPNKVFMHDGLHPAPVGAEIMGTEVADVMNRTGIPIRQGVNNIGQLEFGDNLVANPGMIFTLLSATKTNPLSFNLSTIGWATGLGPARRDSSGRHIGYQFGKLPDCWNFWRSSNLENQTIGGGTGGTYSNFQNYTWSGMVGEYPQLAPYIADSTWPLGSVQVSIVVEAGQPAIKIDFDIPVTGNKNEAFVLSTPIPRNIHGPWDNYGYDTPDQSTTRPNFSYAAGDTLISESDLIFRSVTGDMVCCSLALYTFGINPGQTYGAVRQAFGNHTFFWPPSEIDRIRFLTGDKNIRIRAPAITIPAYKPGETNRYAELKFQFAFDCSIRGAKGSFLIQNPMVRKVTSGIPL